MSAIKLTRPKYVTFKEGQITAVYCKGCGAKIKGLISAEVPSEVERRGNKVIVRERVLLAELPNYTEIEIETRDENGVLAKHRTPICKTCALNESPEFLQAVVEADVDQLVAEAGERRGPPLKARLRRFKANRLLSRRL